MGGAPNPVQGWLGACAGNNGTQHGLEPRASKLQAGRRKHCQLRPQLGGSPPLPCRSSRRISVASWLRHSCACRDGGPAKRARLRT